MENESLAQLFQGEVENFFGKIVDLAADAILAIDETLNFVYFNKEAEKLFGYSAEEIKGKHLHTLIPERFHEKHYNSIGQFIESDITSRLMNDRVSLEVPGLRSDKSEFFSEISIIKIQLKSELFLVAIIRDITKSKEIENKLKVFAEYDGLTGIYNRRKTEEVVENEIGRASRYHKDLAILMLDIDHFKRINDTYGHDNGDLALKHFVKTIKDNLRRIDCFGRWGGEEFIVALPEIDRNGLKIVAEKLRASIENSSIVSEDGDEISFTISIGVSIFGEGASFSLLLKQADQALYLAKTEGRNQYRLNEDNAHP